MLDRFFSCDFQDCDLPSPRGLGPCEGCNLRFCSIHAQASHTCETTPLSNNEYATTIHTEIEILREKLNDDALRKSASELNGGLGCEIEHPPAWGRGSLMGCANYHARLRFAGNGSTWLIRVPRVNGAISQQLIDYLIRSEYAMLKFLETTNVPAPRAFGYGIAGDEDNKVGLSYILIEEMPGKPWNGQGPHGKRSADNNDKEKIWNGLADILIELKRHPFHQAGSLLPEDLSATPVVSAMATVEYYTAFVEQILSLIADGQLFPSCPVNAYLVFLYLKSQIGDISPTCGVQNEKFYLKHVDDKGDHLMVDEELSITGIIDWQMARVVPPEEAFGPSLVTADMDKIYNGVPSMTVHDHALALLLKGKGADDLAEMMSKHERLRRFFFGLDVELSWDETLLLVRGVWATFGIERDTDWEVWKREMLKQYGHDERLKRLLG
ncbi:hypothetical protein BDV18DRAFT_158928 [Aspergillus unguis]